jgi:hypothetical protein
MSKTWRAVASGVVWVLWILAFAPIWLWSSMLIEAILTWHSLGHWPGSPPYRPDTGTYQRVAEIAAAIFCTVLAAGIPIAVRRRTLTWQLVAAMTGIIVLWLTALALLGYDPGGVVDWAMD